MSPAKKTNRRQQILEVLAQELESHPGSRITTAALARAVGVSEAALYRHFPSKAKMFEALIDFADETVFGLINKILDKEQQATDRSEHITHLILGFSERNPGITRILLGDALVGENEKLRVRVGQFFERIETQFRQVFREANMTNGPRAVVSIDATANLIMSFIEGRMSLYVRSNFQRRPTVHWDEQWSVLKAGLFKT